jgi:hypothetical protein
MLASLARLFHLAAIRPDKSRGAATTKTNPMPETDCAVNLGFL